MNAAPFKIDGDRELLVFSSQEDWCDWFDTVEPAHRAKFPAKQVPDIFKECPFTISPECKDLIDVQIVNAEEGAYMVILLIYPKTGNKKVLCIPIIYDENQFQHPMSLN